MRQLRVTMSLAACLSITLCASIASAQVDSARAPATRPSVHALTAPPLAFNGYTLASIEQYTDRFLGTMYRFMKEQSPWVDVFVFPYRDSAALRNPEIAMATAQAAADDFVVSLPIMQRRGMIDDYRMAFSSRDSLKSSNVWIHGNSVGAALKRRGEIQVSLFYIYAFPTELVKVRVDLPLDGWMQSDVPAWTHSAVVSMFEKPEYRAGPESLYVLPPKIRYYTLYTTAFVRDSAILYYRYTSLTAPDIRVIVQPPDPGDKAGPGRTGDSAERARARVAAEAYTRRMTGSDPLIADYKPSYARPDTAAIPGGNPKIGYTAGGTFRCGAADCADMYFTYLVGDRIVAVSARMLQSGAATSDAPAFVHALIASLVKPGSS